MFISTLPSTLKAQFLISHKKPVCGVAKGLFRLIFKTEDTEAQRIENRPTQTSPWHADPWPNGDHTIL